MCVLHVRARVWVTTLISWPVGGEPRKLKFLRRLHPTPGLPTTPSQNILLMVVTLDVSKLSSWLNASAFCRESQGGGHAVRGSASGMHGEGLAQPDSRLRPRRARAERTINM